MRASLSDALWKDARMESLLDVSIRAVLVPLVFEQDFVYYTPHRHGTFHDFA